jgi:hypothetical protein
LVEDDGQWETPVESFDCPNCNHESKCIGNLTVIEAEENIIQDKES